MRICECGQPVGDIRMADGTKQTVNPHPIRYRETEHDTRMLYTKDGRAVKAASCRPEESQGIGYPEHRCNTQKPRKGA